MGKDDDFKDLEDVLDDDDKTEKDDVTLDDDEEDVDLEGLMAGIKDDDSDDVDDGQDPEDDESDDDKKGSETDDDLQADDDEKFNKRLITELNRIVPQRLARDRKSQEVAYLENVAGMPIDKITEKIIQNMVDEVAEDMGVTEDQARKIVQDRIENVGLKTEKSTKAQEKQDVNSAMKQVNYLQDQMNFTKDPEWAGYLSKEIVKEIDAFTQNGSLLSFEDGMYYVLGKNTPERSKKIRNGAINKAQADMQKKKAVPQTNKTASGKADGTVLTKEQRALAINLGLTSKEDLASFSREISRENKRKQSRAR